MERLKQFAKGMGVFFLYFLILPIIFESIFKNYIKSSNKVVVNITLSLIEIAMFAILFMIYRKQIINDIKKFKNDYKKNLDIGFKYYFVALIVMIVSNLLLNIATGSLAVNESVNREYIKMYPVYSVIAMILVGPFVEEIIFRLGFKKAFKNWFAFALFSGFFFGGLHIYTAYAGHSIAYVLKNWYQMLYIIPYGSLGFAFAKAYYETDNICTTALIHLMHNAFTILLIVAAASAA